MRIWNFSFRISRKSEIIIFQMLLQQSPIFLPALPMPGRGVGSSCVRADSASFLVSGILENWELASVFYVFRLNVCSCDSNVVATTF